MSKKAKEPVQAITQTMIDSWNATDTTSITYTDEQLEKWVKEGKIPKDLGEFALAEAKKIKQTCSERKKLMVKDPDEKTLLGFCEQHAPSIEDMKKSVEFQKFVLENKESLLKIIEGAEKKKKFRVSGHYLGQTLQYEKPSSRQLNIFDLLSPETIEKIKEETVHYIGIRNSPEESKLVNAITRLLERKSQTINYKSDDFYMGNEPTRLVPYGGNEQKGKSAVLRFKKHELLTEFFSTKEYSGADIKYFDKVFDNFKDKKCLTRYTRVVQEKDGEKEYIAEDYLPLIRVIRYFPNLSPEDAKKVRKNEPEYKALSGEYILSLNPIITDQIDSKYVEFPVDIDYRTKIAAESHLSVSEAIILMRDWLISEMSIPRYKTEINEENLIYKLRLDKHLKSRKKNRLKLQLDKAIQVSRHLGIILDVEETCGAAGQKKYIFKLNKDFE